MRLLFDTETNGLLPDVSRMHCMVIRNVDTGETWSFADQPGLESVQKGIALLSKADTLIGHNIIRYDLPVLDKLYPGWRPEGWTTKVRDTLVLTRVLWPEIKKWDFTQQHIPKHLAGKHSLEVWGLRLGEPKAKYEGGWENWSPEMHAYMLQDANTTAKLWAKIEAKKLDERAIEIEMEFAEIIRQQIEFGVRFNVDKAHALAGKITAVQAAIRDEVSKVFQPWWVGGEPKTPAKTINYKKQPGVVEGAPYTPVKLVVFNPDSRQHVADRLQVVRGWKPTEFGADGVPTIDDSILSALPFPEAKPLSKYFLLAKRLGFLSTGKQALTKKVGKDGRIHGEVNTVGAVTMRCAHSGPNVAQTPKVGTEWGAEMRELFEADEGWVLVGADAAGCQMRMLAHYMSRYDGGAYVKVVCEGNEAEGTDLHSVNARALGLEPQKVYELGGKSSKGRNTAKTFFYALIFGAFYPKLGWTVLGDHVPKEKARAVGKQFHTKFMRGLPAYGSVAAAVEQKVKKSGFLVGLDGRHLPIRSAHSALCTLLQSAEAIAVKLATNLTHRHLRADGLIHGRDYKQVIHAHDELQITCRPEIGEHVGKTVVRSIQEAGQILNLRCPLDGSYKIGANWRETH